MYGEMIEADSLVMEGCDVIESGRHLDAAAEH